MTRLLCWITVEVTTGLIMLFAGLMLVLRPYASGLVTLENVFALDVSFPLFRTSLFVFGVVLILLRNVKWYVFVLLFSPLWLYALSLVASTALGQNVGPMGFIYALLSCELLIYIQALRPKSPAAPPEPKPPSAE